MSCVFNTIYHILVPKLNELEVVCFDLYIDVIFDCEICPNNSGIKIERISHPSPWIQSMQQFG